MSYLSKALGLGVLLKAEGREVHSTSEYLRFRQNTDTTYTVNLHLHVGITVGVTQVCQMRPPGRVLCVALHNHSILIQRVGERKRGLRLLPAVQVIRLLSAQPVG